MAYRLRPSEPFTAEFCSVARQQLSKAISYLEDQPDGPHEAIHDARKRFKRIRSLYRLIQPDAPDFRRQENARIRDIARQLSSVRDATALVETVTYLADFAASPEEKTALETARTTLTARRDRIAAEEHDLPAKIASALEGCREAIDALDALNLSDTPRKTAKHLGKAWRKQLAKAHAAVRECEKQGGAESYHELRKSGQAYWMHLSLLREIWPSAMQAKQNECKTLVDLLGHEHDLSVLTELADKEPSLFGSGDRLARLLAAIINRQQTLRRDAMEKAQGLLAETPAEEAALITLLWERAAGTSSGKTNRNAAEPRKAEEESALRGAR